MSKHSRNDIFDELPPIAKVTYNIMSLTYDGLSFLLRLIFKSRDKNSSNDHIAKTSSLDQSISNVSYNRVKVASELKGSGFENFVVNRFCEDTFSIVEMTHKFAGPGDRYIESDLNPDFTFRHKPTGAIFAVEAKFRSHLNKNGMLEWSNPDQLERYRNFSKERGIPVYIVIGLYWSCDYPKEVYVIPLEIAKYPALYPSIYKKYLKNPSQKFYWENGMLC